MAILKVCFLGHPVYLFIGAYLPGRLKLHTSNELVCLCSLTFKINRKHIGELLCFHTKVQNFFCSELLSVFFAAQGRMIKVMDQIEWTFEHLYKFYKFASLVPVHCNVDDEGNGYDL